ncbi:hypothetical protein C8034_v003729 [Colletotrichum sidae]|uniref:Tafazzin n=1 Tax=Colletotrichum sidae TaxID=1347389 RepID=A0A4R8T9Q4_9PEZI|nr:hypothetical protein C8034_v003729 [Colletotrichum sidae]
MPKKRHQAKYSKPQSTAPSSLGASSSASTSVGSKSKGVNELLADLRRSSLASSSRTTLTTTTPTVPPALQHILQIPDLPPQPPRRVPRFDATGRRLPPGPPPPLSWLSRSSSNVSSRAHANDARRTGGALQGLPGSYEPDKGSLMDMLLRRMAMHWHFQRDYDRYYLHTLPTRVRAALVRYVGLWHETGLSAGDLRNILIPPTLDEEDGGQDRHGLGPEDLVSLNCDIYALDLAGSVGNSMTVKELADVIYPRQLAREAPKEVQESWDTADAPSLPPTLLPNLTHLSLAAVPGVSGGPGLSWKQLLSFAAKSPTLTHLSLAYWPEPTLTPNAKATTMVSPEGHVAQYSSTGPYAHTLDDNWSEAVILLRKLSKLWYRLEHLDLTGCSSWWKALKADANGNDAKTSSKVDWCGPWGKVSHLRLRYGYELDANKPFAEKEKIETAAALAKSIEMHIILKRSGQGRFITVDSDRADDVRRKVADIWPSFDDEAD